MHCGSTSAVPQDLAQGESVARALSGDPPRRGRSRKAGQQGPRQVKRNNKKEGLVACQAIPPPTPCTLLLREPPDPAIRREGLFLLIKVKAVVEQESLGYILRGSGGEPTTDQGKVPAGLLTAEVPT